MILLYILGILLVIGLLISAFTVHCPNCGHRFADKPYDVYYTKNKNHRKKVSVYYCEKCKIHFEK